jgi:hypothetical protein
MNKRIASIAIILPLALVASIMIFSSDFSTNSLDAPPFSPSPSNANVSLNTTPSQVISSPSTPSPPPAASPTQVIPPAASPTMTNQIIVEMEDTATHPPDYCMNVNVTKVVVTNIGANDVTVTSLTLVYMGGRNESQGIVPVEFEAPVPVHVQVPIKSTVEIPTVVPILWYGQTHYIGYCIQVQTDRGFNATSLMLPLI